MSKQIKERDVEKYLKAKVKEAGGEIRKVQWVGRRGAPDRVVFLHGCHFVELKAPGKKPEAHQDREHERMRKHGVHPWVIDSFEQVDLFMEVLPGV